MVDFISSIPATPKLGIRVSDAVLSPVPPVEPSISSVRPDTGSLSVSDALMESPPSNALAPPLSSVRSNLGVYSTGNDIQSLIRPLRYDSDVIKGLLSGEAESLKFLDRFWMYRPTNREIAHFQKFCRFVKVYLETGLAKETARRIGIDGHQARTWRDAKEVPVLMKLFCGYCGLAVRGPAFQLLPMRIERNFKTLRGWTSVPATMRGEKDVSELLSQLQPLPEAYARAGRFQVKLDAANRRETFAFLLGVMVGDAGKAHSLQEDGHRLPSTNLRLNLTKRFEHSERFGEYTAMCYNALGLRMYRVKDSPPDKQQLKSPAKAGKYNWNSERSPLVAWIFNNCLGLDFRQNTTTTPVRMEWIFNTSREFRIAFLQGIAESDGHVTYAGTIMIVSYPNVDFLVRLLRSVGVECWTQRVGGKESVVCTSVKRASSINLFNEHIFSIRYQRMMKIANADRMRGSWPSYIEEDIVRLSAYSSVPAITKYLLDAYYVYKEPGTLRSHMLRSGIIPIPGRGRPKKTR